MVDDDRAYSACIQGPEASSIHSFMESIVSRGYTSVMGKRKFIPLAHREVIWLLLPPTAKVDYQKYINFWAIFNDLSQRMSVRPISRRYRKRRLSLSGSNPNDTLVWVLEKDELLQNFRVGSTNMRTAKTTPDKKFLKIKYRIKQYFLPSKRNVRCQLQMMTVPFTSSHISGRPDDTFILCPHIPWMRKTRDPGDRQGT